MVGRSPSKRVAADPGTIEHRLTPACAHRADLVGGGRRGRRQQASHIGGRVVGCDAYAPLMDWQELASVAGVIGLGLASYTFVSDRLVQRRSEVEVRFRQIPGERHASYRMVVENHGPHRADGVSVELVASSGVSATGLHFSDSFDEIGTLWPDQTYEAGFLKVLASDLKWADVSWDDGRIRRQARRYRVSYVHD